MDKLYAKEIKKITIRQSKGVGTSRLIYERLNYIFISRFFFSSPLSSVFQYDSYAFCGVLFYLAILSFFYLSCPLMVIVIKRLKFSPSFSFLAIFHILFSIHFLKCRLGESACLTTYQELLLLVMIPFTLVTLMFDLGLTL